VKQPIEISLAVVLLIGAIALFWSKAQEHPAPHGAKSASAKSGNKVSTKDACTLKCEQVAADKKCTRGDKCAENCLTLDRAKFCKAEVATFMECFLREPSDHWRCEDDGVPTLGHVCEPEQNRIADCMMKHDRQL